MATRSLTTIVLAAGAGTRMRSATPKVLHGFAGRTMLQHVLIAAQALGADHTLVVVGHGRDAVTAHLADVAPAARPVVQHEQRGTGDAVAVALRAVPPRAGGRVLVLPGDAPLLTPSTLTALLDDADAQAGRGWGATMLTSVVADPTGYGRVVRDADGSVRRVVEHADASDAELGIAEVAAGGYLVDEALLRDALTRLGTDNAQGEFYLPDVVALLRTDGHRVAALVAPATETAGVNDRVQLADARRTFNDRLLATHMRAGVDVVDPATTWVDAAVTIDADATLLPATDLHGATHVAAGAQVGPHTTLTNVRVGRDARVTRTVATDAEIGDRATVGPFSVLRAGARLAADVHVGSYVEIKNSEIGTGSKVPHLSYVGDATIGRQTNVGAATVFVNYDGVSKHHSVVGDHVRIGSDSMIVAPRVIGDGAYTAAGTIVTQDVPAGSLARSSARPQIVAGWTQRKRPGTAAAEAAAASPVDPDTPGATDAGAPTDADDHPEG